MVNEVLFIENIFGTFQYKTTFMDFKKRIVGYKCVTILKKKLNNPLNNVKNVYSKKYLVIIFYNIK